MIFCWERIPLDRQKVFVRLIPCSLLSQAQLVHSANSKHKIKNAKSAPDLTTGSDRRGNSILLFLGLMWHHLHIK